MTTKRKRGIDVVDKNKEKDEDSNGPGVVRVHGADRMGAGHAVAV